jgi:hypothetical protein
MKNLIFFIFSTIFLFNGLQTGASTILRPGIEKKEWERLLVKDVVQLSVKDYCRVTGKTLTVKERVVFKMMQLKMKKALKKNPDLTVGMFLASQQKLDAVWIVLIIALGLILLLFVVFLLSGGLDIGI